MDFDREGLGLETPLHLAVLARPQWEALIGWQPYGIPGVAGRPPVIFMPAGDDGLAAEDALGLRDRVTPAVQARHGLAALEGVREALRELPARPPALLVVERREHRLPGFRDWAASLEAA